MRIGVLDIQGDVSEHVNILSSLGADPVRVRKSPDLENVDGLILPGGESTVIGKVMKERDLVELILKKKLPVMGTCAGLILMSENVDGGKGLLPLLDIEVKRNGYGSQRESFETDLNIEGIGQFHGVFIRAPIIVKVKKGSVLSQYENSPIIVSEGKHLGMTFHPEIFGDGRIHRMFIDSI